MGPLARSSPNSSRTPAFSSWATHLAAKASGNRLTHASTIMAGQYLTQLSESGRRRSTIRAMHDLGFRPFDADNHYYEAEDAFTRYIDPAMAKRCMQWADVGGKKRLLVGGKINKFIPNPTFDPIAKPGSLETYFRGRNEGGMDLKTMFGELSPIAEHPGYREP